MMRKRNSENNQAGKQDIVCLIQYDIFIYRVIETVLRLNHHSVRTLIVMMKDYMLYTRLMMAHLKNIWEGKDRMMSHTTYETAAFTTCHLQISVQWEKNDSFSIYALSSSVTMALTRNPFILFRKIVLRRFSDTIVAWHHRPPQVKLP